MLLKITSPSSSLSAHKSLYTCFSHSLNHNMTVPQPLSLFLLHLMTYPILPYHVKIIIDRTASLDNNDPISLLLSFLPFSLPLPFLSSHPIDGPSLFSPYRRIDIYTEASQLTQSQQASAECMHGICWFNQSFISSIDRFVACHILNTLSCFSLFLEKGECWCCLFVCFWFVCTDTRWW